jgi:hypothetical protein
MKQNHRGVKTTIELPEPIWRAAKQRALDDGLDLRSIVIVALERYLGKRRARKYAMNRRTIPSTPAPSTAEAI